MKTILIIGCYGNAGFLIAKYLIELNQELHIILAGRNIQKANKALESLQSITRTTTFSSLFCDASDYQQLLNIMTDVDIVIVASPGFGLTENIVNAAINTKTDYFDVNLSTKNKIDYLFSKKTIIEKNDLCFITDGGFHPGLPAAMIRYACEKHDNIYSANVYSVMQMDWSKIYVSDETGEEMVMEFKDYKPEIFTEGKWITPKAKYLYRNFDFSAPYNSKSVVPMTLEELKIIPKLYPSIKETGFFVAGFNKFTDYFTLPLIMYVLLPLFGNFSIKLLAKLFLTSLRKFSKPPFGLKLVADIHYKNNEKDENIRYEISHNDGYELTAIPVVATLKQYLNNRKSGLYFQAEFAEPLKLFEDMQSFGIKFSTEK